MVSIIITTFNYSRYIAETISSVRSQLVSDWECIIIDNGSTDNTIAVVNELIGSDSRFSLIRQENIGVSGARNAGLKIAKGEFIQFLDGDDLLQENKISSQQMAFSVNSNYDIIYGGVRFFDDGKISDLRTSLKGDKPDNWMPLISGKGSAVLCHLKRFNFIVTHSPLVRKRVIDRVGLFDESISALEDWDFWMRCAYAGCYFHYQEAKNDLSLVRVHKTSLSNKKDLMIAGNFIVLQKRIYENLNLGDTFYFLRKHAELFWDTKFSPIKIPVIPLGLLISSILLFPLWFILKISRAIIKTK